MYTHSVGDEASVVEDETSLFRGSFSSSRHPSRDTCFDVNAAFAAAAAYDTFRQLATEVVALDDATYSVVEKLVKAAAKRRAARGDSVASNQQETWISEQRLPQETKKQEKRLDEDSQREMQHEEQRLLRRERELLALWGEGTSQPENIQKQSVSPPLGKNSSEEEERVGNSLAEETRFPAAASAASSAPGESEITEPTSVAATGTATQATVHEDERSSTSLSKTTITFCPLSPSVAADDGNDGESPSAAMAAVESAGDTITRISAADETLMELEELFVGLQELLNRLYNVALRGQELLDDLQYRLHAFLAQQAAAAAQTATATAGAASGLPHEDEEEAEHEEEGAATCAMPRAASKATPIELGRATRAAAGKSDEAEGEKEEREGEGEGRREYRDDNGERRGEEEEEERQSSNACSSVSTGGHSVSVAAQTTKKSFHRQRKEQKTQRNSLMCKISHNKHHLREKERQQQDQKDEQRVESKKQQQFPQRLQQGSQPQPGSSQAAQAWQQHQVSQQEQALFSGVAFCPIPRQKKQLEKNPEVQVDDDWKRIVVLLQLYEAIVRTIEGEWHFKQEVKEEMRFETPFKVFLAARAAWRAKPFVSDLAPLLREAGSLAEEYCCSNSSSKRQQQRASLTSHNPHKQDSYRAAVTPTTTAGKA